MKKITVIIPSRNQPSQIQFLNKAVASIKSQTTINDCEIEIIICLDKGQEAINLKEKNIKITFIESATRGQAAALNAGIDIAGADYIAFLEDDDEWHNKYLYYALKVISITDVGFVSSTQLEHDESGKIIRINDFPTPSGWFMTKETLLNVGRFNEDYRFHLDNEWLGRLSEARIQRIHLVESTAPINLGHIEKIRPWLNNVIVNSDGFVRFFRHTEPFPLVNRLVHSQSGLSQIASDPDLNLISNEENKKLTARFKRLPW